MFLFQGSVPMEKETSVVKFWVEDPCVLFRTLEVLPTREMTKEQKLNALTRLVVLVALGMYFLQYDSWFLFLVLGILLLIGLNYVTDMKPYQPLKEDFSIVPTYSGTDLQQTTVTPTFAEEWHVPPPAYDLYTQVPVPSTFEEPLKPQTYPYGQYLTKTNLLPSDEYVTHTGTGSHKTAREYVNSSFLRHDLSHRENMMRIYKKKLNRRFRHNCQDTISPYHSY